MNEEEPEVLWENRIVCCLPITRPTSRVRVKRNYEPISVRQTVITGEELIEWQISYRKGNELVEAGKMLELGYKHDLFARSDLEALKEYAEKKKPTFDQYFSIKRERVGDKFLDEYEIIVKQVPRIRRDLENGCFVEVEREHRQKAVGYQSMLYIYIPIKNVDPPLVGRHARPKEVVKWYPTKKDIEGIIKTFSIISEMHKGDIVKIISKLLETK